MVDHLVLLTLGLGLLGVWNLASAENDPWNLLDSFKRKYEFRNTMFNGKK
jgi:hypothetical protein